MSNERNDSERLVSDAYHELADEKTPETLNREVLRLAANEGRTRYAIARGWMRPAAWAATIGLSLVVVLELTNVPESDIAPLPQSVALDSAAAPADRGRESINEETVFEPEAGEQRQEALAKRSRPYSPQEQMAEKTMMLDDAPIVSEDAAEDDAESLARDVARASETDDLDTMRETLERARQQAGQPALAQMDVEQAEEPVAEKSADNLSATGDETEWKQPAAATAHAESFAAGISNLRADEDYLCPAEARLSADKWLECIEKLETSAPRELIDREYEALSKSFPEFEHPAADK